MVQDWSVGEMRFGRKMSYPDKTIRTETALIYDAVQLFGKALTDLDRSQVRKKYRPKNQRTFDPKMLTYFSPYQSMDQRIQLHLNNYRGRWLKINATFKLWPLQYQSYGH